METDCNGTMPDNMRFLDEKRSYKKESPRNLYLGVELEIDRAKDVDALSDEIYEINKNVVFHDDASLSEKGIEIVSPPCTIAAHRNFLWPEIFRVCRVYKAKSHDAGNCGLHIHFNHSYLGPNKSINNSLNSLKLVYLFERFEKELKIFSRRAEHQMSYCYFSEIDDKGIFGISIPKKPNESLRERIANEMEERLYNDGGCAVSLCGNYDETIEIRLWRGTLNINTFFATLEMTNNLVKLVTTLSTRELKIISWGRLCKKLLDYERTDYLGDYLRKKGLIKGGKIDGLYSTSIYKIQEILLSALINGDKVLQNKITKLEQRVGEL